MLLARSVVPGRDVTLEPGDLLGQRLQRRSHVPQIHGRGLGASRGGASRLGPHLAFELAVEVRSEIADQRVGIGIALVPLDGESSRANGIEGRRHLPRHSIVRLDGTAAFTRQKAAFAAHPDQKARDQFALVRLERRHAHQNFVEHRAESIDVAPRVERTRASLLGAHVRQRACEAAVGVEMSPYERVTLGLLGGIVATKAAAFGTEGGSAVRCASRGLGAPFEEPPVHHVHLTELAEHDVLRLEIAVQKTARMGEGHRFAHAEEGLEQGGQRFGPGISRSRLLEDLLEVDPLHELHGKENPPVPELAHVVHRNDARVVELRSCFGFVDEAKA